MNQGDVLLRQTNNDGDIAVEGGQIALTGGFETMVYLSLFGGQADWWGDLQETEADFRTVSETEALVESLPAVPANLRLLEQAALRDLAVFTSQNIASRVEVVVTMPGVDRVNFSVTIEANGEESTFEFTQNWRAAS